MLYNITKLVKNNNFNKSINKLNDLFNNKFILLIPICYAIFHSIKFIFNWESAWQHPEVNIWKYEILKQGFPFSLKKLTMCLNWPLMEYEPRITRPLSNLFELIDTPFRGLLHNFILPSPSFSLTILFTLVFGPILLFLLLKRLHIKTWIASLATALYIGNPGILSFNTMLFRPGKAMANTAILFCLWLAALYNSKYPRENYPKKCFNYSDFFSYCFLLITIFLNLFWDEVTLIIIPAIIIFFPRIIFRNKLTKISFALIPLMYITSIKWIIPKITVLAGYQTPYAGYNPAKSLLNIILFNLPINSYLITIKNIVHNSFLVIMDSLGLINPFLCNKIIYFLLFLIISVICFYHIIKIITKSNYKLFLHSKNKLLMKSIIILLFALIYHGLLMTVSWGGISNRPWGLYYYGVFCVIFFIILLASIWESIKIPQFIIYLFVFCIITSTTYIFRYTNNAYKYIHYNPGENLINVFNNKINRFTIPNTTYLLKQRVFEIKESIKTHTPVSDIPSELFYLLIELNIIQKSLPLNTIPYHANINWINGQPNLTFTDSRNRLIQFH